MIKKIIVGFLICLTLLPVYPVKGIDLGLQRAKQAAVNSGFSPATTETTFSETIGVVIKSALAFVGVIFLGLMVYAGFLWMTARGKEDQIDRAIDMIRAAIIGLIIATGAYSITALVLPKILERTAAGTSSTESGRCVWIGQNGNTADSKDVNSTDECRVWCNAKISVEPSGACLLNGTQIF